MTKGDTEEGSEEVLKSSLPSTAKEKDEGSEQRRLHVEVANANVSENLLLTCLQRGTGKKTASFKSLEEKYAMTLAIAGKSDFLLIDRTGGGKSAVVSGPAAVQDGVTISMVALNPLCADFEKESHQLKIYNVDSRSTENGDGSLPTRGIILCSPEDVMYREREYTAVVRTLYLMGRLRRVVVDEAHVTLLSDHYRSSMSAMKRIRPEGVSVQLKMMSATVQISIEGDVIVAHGGSADKTVVVRGNLIRDNVAIHVDHLKIGEEKFLLEGCVRKCVEFLVDDRIHTGKHIILVLTRGHCEEICNRLLQSESIGTLNVTIIRHHGDLSHQEKKNAVDWWHKHSANNESKDFVMVATEGYNTGMNALDVRTVTIAGCSRSMMEAWQTMGRVSRDGATGVACFLYHRGHLERSSVKHPWGMRLLRDFQSWIESKDS